MLVMFLCDRDTNQSKPSISQIWNLRYDIVIWMKIIDESYKEIY